MALSGLRGGLESTATLVPAVESVHDRRNKCSQPVLCEAAMLWWQTCRRTSSGPTKEEMLPQ